MIEEQLKAILEKTFDCNLLDIENQSHLHAGHLSSPESGESHFKIKIVSKDFIGMSKVSVHRLINQAVAHLFDDGLHALSIKASSFENKKH